jgi:hypothetical protein
MEDPKQSVQSTIRASGSPTTSAKMVRRRGFRKRLRLRMRRWMMERGGMKAYHPREEV